MFSLLALTGSFDILLAATKSVFLPVFTKTAPKTYPYHRIQAKQADCRCTGNLTWDTHRSVVVVTYIGTPVEEACVSIRMQSEGVVIHIEYGTTSALLSALNPSYPLHRCYIQVVSGGWKHARVKQGLTSIGWWQYAHNRCNHLFK